MRLFPSVAVCAVLALIATPLGAVSFDDYPTRAAGLWRITTSLDTETSEEDRTEVIQVCLGPETDRNFYKHTAAVCELTELNRQDDRVDYTMRCEQGGTVIITKGRYLGNFNSAYTAITEMTSEPPIPGISGSTVTQKALRLGDCKPGQKPGDTIMPGFGGAE